MIVETETGRPTLTSELFVRVFAVVLDRDSLLSNVDGDIVDVGRGFQVLFGDVPRAIIDT
jgi:hypothetical protein